MKSATFCKGFLLSLSLSLSLSNKSSALKKNSKIFQLVFAVLFLGLFFGFSSKASAATYYVDCTRPNDDGAGTSEGTAWKTIAKVNATLTGDQSDTNVLFKKDCTWRETLNVPGSGTSGHPFTFGEYGTTGANPIINGSNILTGWASDATWATVVTQTPTTDSGATNVFNGRAILTAAHVGATGSKVRITFKATSGYDMVISGASIGPRSSSTSTFSGTPTRITFDGGSTSTTVTANTTKVSDEITYDLTAVAQLIHVYSSSPTFHYLLVDAGGDGVYRHSADGGPDETLSLTTTGTLAGARMAFYTKIEAYQMATTYSVLGVTTQPYNLFYNGTWAVKGSSATTLADHQWYWASNVLYFRDDSGNPDTTGIVIEAGQRQGVWVNGKSYLIWDGIDVIKANSSGLEFYGGGSNAEIKNSVFSKNFKFGVLFGDEFATGYNSSSIHNCTTTLNGEGGIQVSAAGTGSRFVDSITIRNNISESDCIDSTNTYTGAIKGYGVGSTNIIIQNNTVHYSGKWTDGTTAVSGSSQGHGIWVDTIGSGGIIRYNKVYSNKTGIIVECSAGVQISYNLTYSNNVGIHGIGSGACGVSESADVFYNNVAYGNAYGIRMEGPNSGSDQFINNQVKNNISTGNTTRQFQAYLGAQNDGTIGHGNIYTYNSFGPESSNFIEWSYGTYKSTYSAWETTYGGTTNSVQSDPIFTNAAGNVFTLQSTSPAINAGTPVGLTTDYASLPVPSGLLPDIGAYEYQDVTAPVGGSFIINSNDNYTTSTSATLNITCPTDSWTPVQMAYGDSLNPTNWENCDTSKAWTLPTGDGTKTVHMRFRDGGLVNITSDTTDTIILDTTGPTGSITNDSGDPTNDPTPTFNLTIADAGVGIASAQMRFSGNNSTYSSWEAYSSTKTNFNINTGEGCANADGTKKIYIQFKDSLGNIGLAYNTGDFTLDTTASNAALSNTPATHGIYTSSTSADITVGGTGVVSYKYKLDSGSYGDETLIATHLILSDLSEGSHTLQVIGKDSVGNWQSESDATSYSWTIDTHAPERSDKAPSGELSSGTTSTTLSLTTGEVATCKYDTTSKDYGDMDNSFTTADGLSHSAAVNGLTNGTSYNYYVRCQDTAENANDTDYLISFSIASAPNTDSNTDNEKDPNLHNLKSSSTENSITLTWKTDHNTKSTIRYGTDRNLKEKKKDNSKEKKHKVVLKNLLPNTKYYFRIKATDSDDNEDSSSIHSIMTKTVPTSNSNLNTNSNANTNQLPIPTENIIAPSYSGNSTPNTCSYAVQSGDTLWSIAKKVYGDATAYTLIIDKNKDKYTDIELKLSIGQELTFCDNNQTQQNSGNNSNQQTQPQTQNQIQSQPETKTFHWWNPFSWF